MNNMISIEQNVNKNKINDAIKLFVRYISTHVKIANSNN